MFFYFSWAKAPRKIEKAELEKMKRNWYTYPIRSKGLRDSTGLQFVAIRGLRETSLSWVYLKKKLS